MEHRINLIQFIQKKDKYYFKNMCIYVYVFQKSPFRDTLTQLKIIEVLSYNIQFERKYVNIY